MSITFRPISIWPRDFTKGRKRSPFKGDYNRTMRLLERELSHARAKEPIVQLALMPSDFRIDGRPYANVNPSHPGVILSFTKANMPLSFPCDTYWTWIENLRAIGLALDSLRRVERYGVTKHAEQYRGWNALPPAIITPQSMTVLEAAEFIGNQIGMKSGHAILARDAEMFRLNYRQAAKRWHPDNFQGVQHPEWNKLQQAKEVLEKHHTVKS